MEIHGIQTLQNLQNITKDQILDATITLSRNEAVDFARSVLRECGWDKAADALLNASGDKARGEIYKDYLLATHDTVAPTTEEEEYPVPFTERQLTKAREAELKDMVESAKQRDRAIRITRGQEGVTEGELRGLILMLTEDVSEARDDNDQDFVDRFAPVLQRLRDMSVHIEQQKQAANQPRNVTIG